MPSTAAAAAALRRRSLKDKGKQIVPHSPDDGLSPARDPANGAGPSLVSLCGADMEWRGRVCTVNGLGRTFIDTCFKPLFYTEHGELRMDWLQHDAYGACPFGSVCVQDPVVGGARDTITCEPLGVRYRADVTLDGRQYGYRTIHQPETDNEMTTYDLVITVFRDIGLGQISAYIRKFSIPHVVECFRRADWWQYSRSMASSRKIGRRSSRPWRWSTSRGSMRLRSPRWRRSRSIHLGGRVRAGVQPAAPISTRRSLCASLLGWRKTSKGTRWVRISWPIPGSTLASTSSRRHICRSPASAAPPAGPRSAEAQRSGSDSESGRRASCSYSGMASLARTAASLSSKENCIMIISNTASSKKRSMCVVARPSWTRWATVKRTATATSSTCASQTR